MKKVLIALVIVLVIGGIVYKNISQNKVKAIDVQVIKIKSREIVEKVSASGRIQPVVQVNISANVAGEITNIYVEEGDFVEAGQRLFQLDKVRYEADVSSTRSMYSSRKASLEKASKDLKRFKGLYKNKNISLAELENSEIQYRLALSSKEQAEAQLNQTRDNLSKTMVKAPISGTVILVRKEEGEIALGSQFSQDVVMIMADLGHMEVEVEVNENDVIRVNRKDYVDIEIDAIPDTTFKGEVSEIAHLASSSGLGTQNAVTNFQVMVKMLELPDEMRPGMSATVEIHTDKRESAVAVPIQCVTIRSEDQINPIKKAKDEDKIKDEIEEEEDKPKRQEMIEIVFIVQGDTVAASPVKLGISSDDYFEVISGLEAGETVVEGPHRVLSRELNTGSKIKSEKDEKGKKKKNSGAE
ncbi:MAG: efflux RND transporter periplasmic adaptor subunit [Candidatus Marinimicrobia bacterium]|nr:efflux RND transporter periplasmic adaptor subunit [Candidatus Neomarinimicrobiota bacterium]